MLRATIVFFAMALLDFVWAKYIGAAGNKEAVQAASWASLLIVLSGVVTTSYVSEPWLLIPAAAGAFVGTLLAIRFTKDSQ